MKTLWLLFVWFTSWGLVMPEMMRAASSQGAASLALAKTASLSTAMVGDVFTYQLTVTNAGQTTVTTAAVRDSLPTGVQLESYSGPGTYTNGLWTFVPGSSGSISTLTITVMAVNTGTVVNTALIQSSTPTDTNDTYITARASVTVAASIPPIVLTCSSNLTVTANASGVAMVYFNTAAHGGCSSPLNLQSSPPSGSTFSIGTTTVYTSANDSCGDQTNCSFTVTVNPPFDSPIVLTCSSNLTITASTPNGTNIYFTTSAYGGCSSPLNLSSSPPSGSTFPIGQTIVTTTASDNCGNITNCTFTVTINPKTYAPIVLSCSSNLTIIASTPNGTNVYFTTSAYGGCSSPLNLSSSPPSGSTFPIGQTVVTTTASDNCGDSTNCTFTVTVYRQTYPAIVLTCSSNLTIIASTPNGTNVYFTTSAYGGCSSPLNLSSSPPSGSTFPIGQTTVTTTASDNCGDSTNCTFTVTVNPKTYPPIVLTCSSNLTITASTPNGTNVYFTTSAYGGCSSPLNLSSSPPNGSTFPIGQTTVTTTASDNCGDRTNCTFTVTVNPKTYPAIVLTCSSNLTITASTPNGTNVYFTTSAYGGCSSPLNLSSSPPSGSTFPIGQTTVTTTATDNCGNSTNCTFTVTVANPNAPSADISVMKTGPPDPVLVGTNITYSIVVSNAGPNTASNVISRDSIPTGTTFVSATPPGYTYYPNFLRVDTAPFNLAAGATFTWTVTVQVTNAQQIINFANAYGTTFDPNTTNNLGAATNNAVNPSADISVVKTGPPDPVLVGTNITYSIVVSNAGPNTASNVISRDSIPTGTTFVSATPPGYTYYPNFLRVDTAPFNLAMGATFTWTVTVQVTNAQQIINYANAYGTTADPNTTNNLGSATNNAGNRQKMPALSIDISGNQLLISWPASLAGYMLESSPDLFSPTWNPVTNPPVFNANGQTVLLPLTSTQQFFQLQPP